MITLLKRSIVEIQKKNGEIVGVGFLVGKEHILTCAHVVREALNLGSSTPTEPPLEEILIDFPFLPKGKKIAATVVYWGPQFYKTFQCEHDIAGLVLTTHCAPQAMPVPLNTEEMPIEKLLNHPFSAFGWPWGNDKRGAWAYGKIKDERPDGTVQLEDEKVTGKPIEGGFSGGPVWDDELQNVIGMITTFDPIKSGTKTAYMIPIQAITKAWIDFKKTPPRFQRIPISVLIVAMNAAQAEELIDNNNNGKFQIFKQYFAVEEIQYWKQHYKESRNDWRPYFCFDKSIRDILCEMVKSINERYYDEGEDVPQILYLHLIENFFDENDEEKQFQNIENFADSGGVVIIDAISLFHPDIQKIFSRSQIISHKNIAILGIIPVNQEFLEKINQIEILLKEFTSIWHAFQRFDGNFDLPCEFGISKLQTMRRWLYDTLPKVNKLSAYEHKERNSGKLHQEYGDITDSLGLFLGRM